MSQCPPRRSLYFQYKHYTPLLTALSLEWNPPAHKSEISHISSRFGQNRTQPNFSNQRIQNGAELWPWHVKIQ